MLKYLFLCFCMVLSSTSFAQQIPSYYQTIDFSASNSNLKQDLSSLLLSTHTYYTWYSEVWEILQQTDLISPDSNDVTLIYGWDNANQEDDDDFFRDKEDTCGNGNPCTDITWNREHVFAKSLDSSNSDNEGATADAHQLRACDPEMNSQHRGSRKFEDGNGIPSYITNANNFFPGEEWKGDVARMVMYMYVHYGEDWNPNFVGVAANTYHPDMPDIFLKWNAEDPPSEQERSRNDIIQPIQGNRNPFIDNPYIATIIWGGPAAVNQWSNMNIISPTSNMQSGIVPNPVEKNFKILNADKNTLYTIYNLEGKTVEKGIGNVGDINLESGVYFIKYNYNNLTFSEKIVIK